MVKRGKKTSRNRVWQDIVPAKSTHKLKNKRHRNLPTLISAIPSRIRTVFLSLFAIVRKHRSQRQNRLILGFVIIIVTLIAFVIYLLLQPNTNGVPTYTSPDGTYTVSQLPAGTPEFDSIIPDGKRIEDFGGWTRVSPTKSDAAFAFNDILGGNSINVSQQKLPDSFKEDVADQVLTLAQDFNAREVLKVGSTIVYIGNSAKGPQSLIFTKNGLLILIRSSVKIDQSLWSTYIRDLN